MKESSSEVVQERIFILFSVAMNSNRYCSVNNVSRYGSYPSEWEPEPPS